MATTNTNAAKSVAKKAAQDPKVAKTVAETATKEGFRNLAAKVNTTNLAIVGLAAVTAVATTRLRELYLATKAKADEPPTPLSSVDSRRSQA